MKGKKLAAGLVVTLAFSTVTPVFADSTIATKVVTMPSQAVVNPTETKAAISKEKAMEIAKEALKKHFNLTMDEKKYQSNIEYRKDWNNPELNVWAMYWNYNDPLEYISAGVTIDGNSGKILEMNKDGGKYGDQTQKKTLITREEAQEKAAAFIQKILPDVAKQIKLMPMYEDYGVIPYGNPGPIFYQFNYQRVVDDAKYDGNYVNVGIDGSTGEIRNFSYRWDDALQLPSKEGIIAVQEAAKLLRDKTKMELIYLPVRDEFNYQPIPKALKLAYRPNYDFANMVDAKTGKLIGWNGKEQDQQVQAASLTEKQISEIKKSAKPIVKQSQEITQERAKELALEIIKNEVGGDVRINNVNYVEGDGYWEAAGRKAWNIDFTVEKKTDPKADAKMGIMPFQNGRVMIDALTEEVLAFSNWQNDMIYGQPFEPVLTWEEAYNKAIDVVKKYQPDKIDQIKTDQIFIKYSEMIDGKEIPPMEYYFNFTRKVNGILYEDNQINISFNTKTGKLQNFSARWNEGLNFPAKDKAISLEAAKDKFFGINEVELAYLKYDVNNNYQNPKYDTRLIYRLMSLKPQYNLIDAVSGKFIDYNGKAMPEVSQSDFNEKIKGHWVEKQAKILAQQGIIDKDIFNPDQGISRLEAVKMLVKSKGMDYYYPLKEAARDVKYSDVSEENEDIRFIYMAVRHGIIENKEGKFNGNEVISRDELVVMLVKMLGYDGLAKASDVFQISFKDKENIKPDLLGYAAIAQGLKLVDGNGSFRPADQATMAETADMIYKALGYVNR
ncbi:hypothetical protein HNQ80_001656 [Anaerosolibacter carboniphilus]|uniref:SLH domain-containing protein n=1 Tax=Anaerosolibacter carboniphilus TaxID=1417629 RepID=A0A841KQ57_9FIRM|nr:YcdB/YcdC domain-containing protein [Anaerosolibacter carboniphilus]MBB6215567.1 hypothetical protein [Anaerosolibacter carboniphilus]